MPVADKEATRTGRDSSQALRKELTRLRKRNEELLRKTSRFGRKVAAQNRYIRVLENVSRITDHERSLEEALERTIGYLCTRLGWETGRVYLPDGNDDATFLDVGIRWPKRRNRTRPDPAANLVAQAVREKRVLWTEPSGGGKTARSTKSYGCALPILVGNAPYGVITFSSSREMAEPFGDNGLIRQFGSQLSHLVERKLAERALGAMNAELLLAEERQRRQIAADLHDEVGQLLSAARMRARQARRAQARETRDQRLRELEEIVDRADRSARSLTFQLSPPVLRERGLVPAVEWLGEEMKTLYDVEVTVQDDGRRKPLSEPVRLTLFRCVRELLANVGRHARVKEAQVRLSRKGRRIEVIVEDEGVGFDVQVTLSRLDTGVFGLLSIRERLHYIGGRFRVRSVPGNGTEVTVTAPLALDPTTNRRTAR